MINVIDVNAIGFSTANKSNRSYIATIQKEARDNLSIYTLMVNLLNTNNYVKNTYSLPLATMFSLADLLVENRPKILEAARNSGTISITKGEGDANIFEDAESTIPSTAIP